MRILIEILFVLAVAAVCYGLSWIFTVGIIYLICQCFSWDFSLLTATGVWLVLMLLQGIFKSSGGGKK